MTKEQQIIVKEKTRNQAKSNIWFKMRTDRVTASKFKAICHTDPAYPSVSLITSIWHPELSTFDGAAVMKFAKLRHVRMYFFQQKGFSVHTTKSQ